MKPHVCGICRHIKAAKGYATIEIVAKGGTKTIWIKLCEECAAASLDGLENSLSEILLHDAVEGALRTMIRWKKELSKMEWRGLKTRQWGGLERHLGSNEFYPRPNRKGPKSKLRIGKATANYPKGRR